MTRATDGWKISVISTDRDLHEHRAQVERLVSELGFSVLAFERPDYPVAAGVSSHRACLVALAGADIVVLIVDSRYGEAFEGQGQISITEAELDEALRLNKIVIPCVSRKTWDTYGLETERQRKLGLSETEYRSRYAPTHVEDWRVLDLIRKVSNAGINNFLVLFRDGSELCTRLEGRLRGLTGSIGRLMVREQVKQVRRTKTMIGIMLSLGDVLEKGYFTEPGLNALTGHEIQASDAKVWSVEDTGQRVIILGEPGSGKSTLLAKAYLKHAGHCLEERSKVLPLFVSLRGRGVKYDLDFVHLIDDCFRDLLGKTRYPVLAFEDIAPCFYIDGFDELSEQSTDDELSRFISSDVFSYPFMACSRTNFAQERLNPIGFVGKADLVLELRPWDEGRTLEYVGRFCQVNNCPSLKVEFEQACAAAPEMSEIRQNPMLLTMFLWVVNESGLKLPLGLTDKASVYTRFLDLWIDRELELPKARHSLRRACQLASWEIYRRRFGGGGYVREQLAEDVATRSPDLREVLGFGAFSGLLDIDSLTGNVRGFVHEQFMEHLLAEQIVTCCRDGGYPFPSFLGLEMRHEINTTIRALWSRFSSKDARTTLDRLWDAYLANMKQLPTDIAIRNHVMYYIGRLPVTEAADRLRQADQMEQDLFVRLSIAFGLVKLGDHQSEDRFFDLVKGDSSWDAANRGYHLVYYRDWILRDESPPYVDDGTRNWSNTFKALRRHLLSNDTQYVWLRRLELFTIRRLMETRNEVGPVSRDDLDSLGKSMLMTPNLGVGFRDKILAEFGDLQNAFKSLAK